MHPSPQARPRGRLGALMLLLLSVVAVGTLATSATLASIALADVDPDPEPCCPMPSSDQPAFISTQQPSAWPHRSAAVPTCLIGSWRVTEQTFQERFYSGGPFMTFRTSGIGYELRPDGTATMTLKDVTLVSSDGRYRKTGAGSKILTWTGNQNTIAYTAIATSQITWTLFDNDRKVATITEPKPDRFRASNTYTCDPNRAVHKGDGYQATWERITTGSGMYG